MKALPAARELAAAVLLAAVALGGAAEAHHLGAYAPKDDAVTASFKRMKVFLEKGRADLLRKEFVGDGAVRRRMAEIDARYRATLVADIEKALAATSIPDAERTLVRFFCFVSREKAQEALERLGQAGPSLPKRGEQGVKLLAAAWRYYNLVDFRVSAYAPLVASGAKLAFEDAEYFLGKSSKGQKAFDESKAHSALTRFRDLMTEFLGAPPPAGVEARRP